MYYGRRVLMQWNALILCGTEVTEQPGCVQKDDCALDFDV